MDIQDERKDDEADCSWRAAEEEARSEEVMDDDQIEHVHTVVVTIPDWALAVAAVVIAAAIVL